MRPAPIWFRRRDYLDGTDRPLREVLDELVADRTGAPLPGPVRVLTQLRTMGWLFNPLTTYYCFEPDGIRLRTVVLEITNTPWHERHWYVLDAAEVRGRGEPFAKEFHVSPFLPMDLTYRCSTTAPGEHLALRLDLTQRDDGRERRVFQRGAHRATRGDRRADQGRDRGARHVPDGRCLGRHLRERSAAPTEGGDVPSPPLRSGRVIGRRPEAVGMSIARRSLEPVRVEEPVTITPDALLAAPGRHGAVTARGTRTRGRSCTVPCTRSRVVSSC